MRALRTVNNIGMILLMWVPILLSGRDNLREQLGYGVGKPWDSWGAIVVGWGGWLVGILLWIALVPLALEVARSKVQRLKLRHYRTLITGRPC